MRELLPLPVDVGPAVIKNEDQFGGGTNFLPLFLAKMTQDKNIAPYLFWNTEGYWQQAKTCPPEDVEYLSGLLTLLPSACTHTHAHTHTHTPPMLHQQTPPCCHLLPLSVTQLPLVLLCPSLSQMDGILYSLEDPSPV